MSTGLSRERQRELGVLKSQCEKAAEDDQPTLLITIHCSADTIDWIARIGGEVFKDYSAAERRKMAQRGHAMPDGCLSADTMIETFDGPRAIGACVGPQTLLTDRGWRTGTVRCFGKRRLFEVIFRRLGVTRSVLATLGHRWYLGDGSVVTTEVLRDRIEADRLRPTKQCVAAEAEKTANLSGHMAVVDMESGPLSASGVASARSRNLQAKGAASTLLLDHPPEVLVRDSVLPLEDSVASHHPAGRSNLNGLSADPSSTTDARLAISTPPLVPHVELSVGLLDSAGAAYDKPDVLDWDASGVLGCGHEGNAIQSWEAVSVSPTDLEEQVYCAVVPGLHRFVLAGGLLTGNSFPIANCEDARNAINAIGRAKDRSAVESHIRRRVRALGCSGPPFDDWK